MSELTDLYTKARKFLTESWPDLSNDIAGPMADFADGEVKAAVKLERQKLIGEVNQIFGFATTCEALSGDLRAWLDAKYAKEINHKNHEFRVWNDENNKAVLCSFDESEFEKVKDYLKQKVIVTGMIKSNASGIPISIEVEELELAPKLTIPTIDEMVGLIPNITEGLSLKEYMEKLSHE